MLRMATVQEAVRLASDIMPRRINDLGGDFFTEKQSAHLCNI